MIGAVVFDLDGVIVDSEQVWAAAREALARERGGRWHEKAQQDMMGMSSTEWFEAARRLGSDPKETAAIEDSRNGILSARAAGIRVIAIPNERFPPGAEVLAEADVEGDT